MFSVSNRWRSLNLSNVISLLCQWLRMTLTLSFASPSSLRLVWVRSPESSAVVNAQPNGHRWLGLLCLLQPSWHSSLGRPAAPWPFASMGHSKAVITSWCFVSIRVAPKMNYGSQLWIMVSSEIQQRVKFRSGFAVFPPPAGVDANAASFIKAFKEMTCH